MNCPHHPSVLLSHLVPSAGWGGRLTLSATLETNNKKHQNILLTSIKKKKKGHQQKTNILNWSQMRNTAESLFRSKSQAHNCLTLAFILSNRHSSIHATQYTQPCANTQNTTDAIFLVFLFNTPICFQQCSYLKFSLLCTDVIKNLWSVWMRQNH